MDLHPEIVFSFTTLRPDLFVYVLENKSVSGREVRAEGDAVGRPLIAAWFETAEHTLDGHLVRRVDRTSASLVTQMYTIAELIHAAGDPYPDLGPGAASKDIELFMEARFAHVPRDVHNYEHMCDTDDPYTFLLTSSDRAEETYLDAAIAAPD